MKKTLLIITALMTGLLSNAQEKFMKVTGLPGEVVSCVAIHPLSMGYAAGTWGDGLTIVYLQNTYNFDKNTPGFPTDNINDIDWQGDSLWIATDSGLVVLSGTNFGKIDRYHTDNSGLPENNVTCIDASYSGGNRAIYAGTASSGLGAYIGGFWLNESTSTGFISNNIKDVLAGLDGLVYVATANAGVAYGKPTQSWNVFNMSNSELGSNNIEGLAITPQGNIWIGTGGFGGGVSVYNGSTVTTYNISNADLPTNLIYNMAFVNDDIMTLGTFGEGMVILDLTTGKATEHYTSQNTSLTSDFINDMKPSYDGTVWLATDEGLWLYNEDGFVNVGGPAFYDLFYSIYPNPSADGTITIQLPAKVTSANITIYDVTGKQVMTSVLSNNYMDNIDVSTLKPGIYYVQAEMPNGIETQKLVLE